MGAPDHPTLPCSQSSSSAPTPAAADTTGMHVPAPRDLPPHHHQVHGPRFYQPYPSAGPSSLSRPSHFIPRAPGMPPTPQSPFPPGLPMGPTSSAASSSARAYAPSYLTSTPRGVPHYTQPDTSPAAQPLHSLPPPPPPALLPPSPHASGSGSSALGLVRDDVRLTAQSWGPKQGSAGSLICVRVHVGYPPPPASSSASGGGGGPASSPPRTRSGRLLIRVVIGVCPVHTTVQSASGGGGGELSAAMGGGDAWWSQECVLGATVPSWAQTSGAAYDFGGTAGGEGSRAVPVCVQMLADDNAIVQMVQLGHFLYTGELSKKRSGDLLESARYSPPEPMNHRRVTSGSSSSTFSGNTDLQGYYSPVSSTYGKLPSAGHYIESKSQSPYAPTSSLPSGPMPPSPLPPGYAVAPQPSLMRTSQLTPADSGLPVTPIMPYVSTGQKASLELNGDLNSVAVGWDMESEEWAQRRRLVQFWRRQEGTTIHAQFRVVSQADWPFIQSSIVVSCLFWEARNACYISSVDVIYLLEALVGSAFTVEEKNRTRRNLEGFRPITVGKGKPETEVFFRQIMNLPNPRPRNIEKNVKVYAWESLGAALKKIIGKYSASVPSGPPSSMPTPNTFIAGPSYPPSLAGPSTSSSLQHLPQSSTRTQSLSSLLPQATATATAGPAHSMSAPLVTQRSDDSSSHAYSQHGGTNPSTPILPPGPPGPPGRVLQPSRSGEGSGVGAGGVGAGQGPGGSGIGLYLDMPGSYTQGATWVGAHPAAGASPATGGSLTASTHSTLYPMPLTPTMGGYPSAPPNRPYPQPHQPGHSWQAGQPGYGGQGGSSSSEGERGVYAHSSGFGGMGSGSESGSGSSQVRGGQWYR